MSKSNEIIDIDEILNRFDAMLQVVSDEIGNEIEAAFETAIADFYASYKPNRYKRTGNIKHLSSGYNDPSSVSVKLGNYRYIAGIKVSPGNVSPTAYAKSPHHGLRVNPYFVYNISYMRGIHGFNRSDLFFKRDEQSGKLLRGNKYKEIKSTLREDNWKPGYNIYFLKDKNDKKSKYFTGNNFWNKYKGNDTNYQYKLPDNSSIPDKAVHETHKNIVKNLDKRIIDAMGSVFSG